MAAEKGTVSPNRMRIRPPRTRASKEFSVEEIRDLVPDHVPYYVTDRNGFAVRVLPSGIKTFYYKYTFKGKKDQINLGNFAEKPKDPEEVLPPGKVTLKMADAKCQELRKICQSGTDPKAPVVPPPATEPEEKTYATMTLAELTDAYKKFMENPRHRASSTSYENARTIDRYIVPFFKQRNLVKVTDIKKSHARALLLYVSENPLQEGLESAPGQARGVLKVARAMFNFGIDKDDDAHPHTNPFSNIAKRHEIEPLMANQKEERALDDDEIRFLWCTLNSPNGPGSASAARSLMLILVTAQRPGEVTGMHRREIKGDWWQIPSSRIKTRRKRKQAHRVFLTSLAKKIIGDFNGYIFPSPAPRCEGRPICERTIGQLVNDKNATRSEWLGLSEEWTPNDLRKTARTLLSKIGCDSDIAERIINHQKAGVRKIYDLYEFDKEKEYWLKKLSEEIERIVGGVGDSSDGSGVDSIGNEIRMTDAAYDVEELNKLVAQMPLTEVARHLGISDNAVRKRCKKHGVELKPQGFWLKGKARGW